ncbi:hypothetical protein VTN31DRAFT_5462 [Thermomyces dupontii]|uniref:uncharacterized protein n=1 Tax=Talaromyces thermophilus TaxID=28565 RepID=UPI00374450D3
MSSPERTAIRASPNSFHSPSPFSRARYSERSSDHILNRNSPSMSSPASRNNNGVRPRTSFGLTSTLRGAFEATSESISMDINGHDGSNNSNIVRISASPNPSPRPRTQRGVAIPSPLAEATSPPPGELLETYRRINEADLVLQDHDSRSDYTSRRSSRERRAAPSINGEEEEYGANLNFLDDLTDDSMRRRLADYKRDEERLKRVTASQSPVLSRGVTSKADTLQRVEREEQPAHAAEEADDGLRPPLNVPRSWGRTRSHREWLNSITRQTPRERRSTERGQLNGRSARSSSPRKEAAVETNGTAPAGDAVSDTPVNRPISRTSSRSSRRDSRELIRKLSRTASPSQNHTPAQATPAEKQVPDKTPVVVGAWFKTPMTQRPAPKVEDEETPSKPDPNPPRAQPLENRGGTWRSLWLTRRTETAVEPKPEPKEEKQSTQTEEKQSQAKSKPPLVPPNLPKSALEAVIEDAKSNGNPVLSDDTINSLQEIIEAGNDESSKNEEANLPTGPDALDSESENLDKGTAPLDRLNNKLQTIIHSIHDARSGLTNLEKRITSGPTSSGDDPKPSPDGRVYLVIPVSLLWRRDPATQRIRPTYLGWALLAAAAWYVTERSMCDAYCHPTVAEVCDGYCLHPDAPRFPFTLPTMLWRWSRLSVVLSPLATLFVALVRLMAQLLGVWDGYVDEGDLSLMPDKPIGSSPTSRGGFYELWRRQTAKVPTTTSSTWSATVSTSTSMSTVLQNVVADNPVDDDDDDVGTMDNDEIL